ncbi:MAG TPA: aldo/keto reductase [Anaerohalosphaeraceae bacterium]|jgi:2,5-diketo-D-gluconate reductase B|nr:aldo/keto reductase [Anaerohalosphaeraceae bacterium]HRT50341.1 aldo/keto reductase [Anaerohalosphaeraceae bacterium]HRT86272.1 aldo/keto reductase [Anaerohalosphaeraceae bacterium]
MDQVTQKEIALPSGYRMPVIGLGTWQLTGHQAEQIVAQALDVGYRHIDTAENYGNEEAIGRAIRGADRNALFITSKVDPSHAHRKGVIEACERTLDRLRTDYLDLYLLHWPAENIPEEETMEGMAWLIEQRMIRSAGLSNFNVAGIRKVMSVTDVPICNNQIEYHPLRNRDDIMAFCRDHAISVTAYSPLARGEVFKNDRLRELAAKYGKTPAQISLRWLIQMGAAVIPKAGSAEHLTANFDLDNFELSLDDMDYIHDMNIERRLIDMHA